MTREIMWRAADWIMLLAFVLSIAVQYNDPDPFPWVVVYAVAAGACVLGLLGRGPWSYPALVAVGSIAWAASIAPRVVGAVPFRDMFGAFEMESAGIEESREMYGLLIIAAWMTVLAVRARPRGRAGAGD